MKIASYAAVSLGLVAAACSGDDGGAAPDSGIASILEPPPAGQGIQVGFDVELEPGVETEYCQYVALPDGADLKVGRMEHAYSPGSHHILLYQTSLPASVADGEIFPCAGASFTRLGIAGIAYAAQVPDGELGFPAATALTLAGDRAVLVQSHYLNASSEPLDAQVRLNLWTAEAPVEVEAGTLFFYDWAIVVPPNQASTAKMACNVPEDVEMVFAMSHMHRRGVGYLAWLDGGAGGAEPTELFTTDQWEGVEPRLFQPSQAVAGGQTIHFECDYQGEDHAIVEGPSADANEMCMFIAAYYPRLDPAVETCFAPGSGPVFDGEATCGEALACVQDADDPVAAEQCVVDTCAPSADATRGLMGCIFASCRAVCDSDDAAGCQACVTGQCQDKLGACLSASCDEE